jgi:hypothetical protein
MKNLIISYLVRRVADDVLNHVGGGVARDVHFSLFLLFIGGVFLLSSCRQVGLFQPMDKDLIY